MSLRTRVLLAMAAIATILVGATVLVTRATRDNLLDRVDAQLSDLASPTGLPRVFGQSRQSTEGEPNAGTIFAWIVARNDEPEPLFRPVTAKEGEHIDLTSNDLLERVDEGAFTVSAQTSGGETTGQYRMLVRPLASGEQAVAVAISLDDVDASMSRLIRLEVIVTVAILAVLGLVAWWVIRLGIRPVKRMTDAATSIGSGNLSHRVPAAADGTEAGELGLALNQMLEQIEDAFATRARSEARLRQFVADASHELRTPVATMRGYAELYRSGGLGEPDQLDDAMRRTESEAERMAKLVDDLLLLARLDQGRPVDQGPVRIDSVVGDVVSDARVRAPERSITVDSPEPLTVIGDANRLYQAFSNLVANAVIHTAAGSRISVAATGDIDEVVVTVTDEGPGMTADVAEHVFERFYRADKARARAAGGSGLGLSIVAATVGAHGGTVAVTSDPDTGTTFTVRLPRGLPAPASIG